MEKEAKKIKRYIRSNRQTTQKKIRDTREVETRTRTKKKSKSGKLKQIKQSKIRTTRRTVNITNSGLG
jgi:hypothetical protein